MEVALAPLWNQSDQLFPHPEDASQHPLKISVRIGNTKRVSNSSDTILSGIQFHSIRGLCPAESPHK